MGDIIIPHTSHEKSGDGWFIDAYGIKRVFAGRYYEISDYPLRGATLKELREYEFPDPDTLDDGIFEAYGKTAKYLYENTDYVIVGEHPVFGVLEIACWMCGFDDFLYRMAAEPEFVHEFFALTLRFQKKLIERYYDKIGRYIHITTSGDDFGTQRAPFVSAAMFDELIAPYFKERIAYTKQFTDAYFFHHTCGSVYKLIGSLIDCGVEILNPNPADRRRHGTGEAARRIRRQDRFLGRHRHAGAAGKRLSRRRARGGEWRYPRHGRT